MKDINIFFIMPFKDEFFEVYSMLQSQLGESYSFNNAGDEGNQQNILRDIIQPIYEADVVIADLTGVNPNVLYELGVAHTLNKKCIVITKDDLDNLPFDLKQYRAKNYDTHFTKFIDLVNYLKKNIDGAIDNTIAFSNPVVDFLNTEDILTLRTDSKVENIVEDNGYLDFMAEIEEGVSSMVDNVNDVIEHMNQLSDGLIKSTDNINKVSGNSKTNFIRKEARRVADLVSNFKKELENHNTTNTDIWDSVENNVLGLLENPHMLVNENYEGLSMFLKALLLLGDEINNNKPQINNFKDTLDKTIGVERTLSQSIKLLDFELEKYLTNSDQIIAGIDRIKDKFVLFENKVKSKKY